jgi:Flp pilus assembly pilin Flp
VSDLYVIVRGLVDRHERGQTMAEYAVVLSVIVIAIVVALTYLSGGINAGISSAGSKV